MSRIYAPEQRLDPWGAADEAYCRQCGDAVRPDEPEILILRADSLEVGRFHRWGCGVAALEWSRPRAAGSPPDLLFMIKPVSRRKFPSYLYRGREGRNAY